MKNGPIVVSLIGSPGAGKSTLSAYIFSRLKMLGINCELVTEFAKDKVWEHNKTALANQVYVFAKQYYRLSRCEDQVDVIITDSPLALTPLYNKEPDEIAKPLNELALAIFNKYDNLTYFVNRVKKYNPIGRNETEEESAEKAVELKKLLNIYKVPYTEIDGNLFAADKVVDVVLERLNSKKCESAI